MRYVCLFVHGLRLSVNQGWNAKYQVWLINVFWCITVLFDEPVHVTTSCITNIYIKHTMYIKYKNKMTVSQLLMCWAEVWVHGLMVRPLAIELHDHIHAITRFTSQSIISFITFLQTCQNICFYKDWYLIGQIEPIKCTVYKGSLPRFIQTVFKNANDFA